MCLVLAVQQLVAAQLELDAAVRRAKVLACYWISALSLCCLGLQCSPLSRFWPCTITQFLNFLLSESAMWLKSMHHRCWPRLRNLQLEVILAPVHCVMLQGPDPAIHKGHV